ncbi:MAG: hypothetical protein B7Z58_17305, partial [Acidiphilium sp. 37-64-53]
MRWPPRRASREEGVMARKYRRLRSPRRSSPRLRLPVRMIQITDPMSDFLSDLVSGARRRAL